MAMLFEQSVARFAEEKVERPKRHSLDLPSSVMVGGKRLAATALDMSRTGVRLRLSQPISVGEEVELELGGTGFVRVRIGWSAGNEAGAVFLDLQ